MTDDIDICRSVRKMAGGWSAACRPWLDVLLADPCAYCGVRVDPEDPTSVTMTMDHVTPIRDGAKVEVYGKRRPPWHNAAPACKACNPAKGALSLLAFVAAGGLTAARGTIRRQAKADVRFGEFIPGCRLVGLMPDGRLVAAWYPRKWFPPRA